MKRLLLSAIITLTLWSVVTIADDYEARAKTLVAEFVGTLKPELQLALKKGGPVHAIEVCPAQAPIISASLSDQNQQIRRVSLKARNASRAIPDAWERQVLMDFDQQAARGTSAGELNFGAIKGGHYRYMQAQVVEPVCLLCHGTDISEEVADTLGKYYPDDRATGYRLGQVRGAISVSLRVRE